MMELGVREAIWALVGVLSLYLVVILFRLALPRTARAAAEAAPQTEVVAAPPAAVETERGHLAGVLSGVAGVQPAVRPLARRAEPAATRAAQHPGPDADDGLRLHPTVDPLPGRLAQRQQHTPRRAHGTHTGKPLAGSGRVQHSTVRVCWALTLRTRKKS